MKGAEYRVRTPRVRLEEKLLLVGLADKKSVVSLYNSLFLGEAAWYLSKVIWYGKAVEVDKTSVSLSRSPSLLALDLPLLSSTRLSRRGGLSRRDTAR